MKRNHTSTAFTLVELIIAVTIISIITSIALPAMTRAKMGANEGSAAVSLRSFLQAQTQFRDNMTCDTDGDCRGEFGLLGELTGASNIRTDGGTTTKLALPFLPHSFNTNDKGQTSKSGYNFKVFLPGETAVVYDTSNNQPGNWEDADYQENQWIAYAWPATFGVTGMRVFAIDNQGTVIAADNHNGLYNGNNKQPQYNAAMTGSPSHNRFEEMAVSTTGIDGQRWLPAN